MFKAFHALLQLCLDLLALDHLVLDAVPELVDEVGVERLDADLLQRVLALGVLEDGGVHFLGDLRLQAAVHLRDGREVVELLGLALRGGRVVERGQGGLGREWRGWPEELVPARLRDVDVGVRLG